MLPDQHFALGYDTFVRLLDLKYYESSEDKLLEILKMLDDVGTKFLVAGRLNQTKNLFEYLDDEALDIVPTKYLHMFQAVKDFRVDLSSTELRAKGIQIWECSQQVTCLLVKNILVVANRTDNIEIKSKVINQ